MFSSKNLIGFLIVLTLCEFASANCGLPGMSYGTKVRNLKTRYIEGDKVEYYCEMDSLILRGNQYRYCLNGRWNGSAPGCCNY